jgi:hypothetical protein
MQDPSACEQNVRETGRACTGGAATVQSVRADAKTWSDGPVAAGRWDDKDGAWDDEEKPDASSAADAAPPTLETGHALITAIA